MKKISSLFINIVMIVGLAGCSTDQKENNKNEQKDIQETKTTQTVDSSANIESEIIDLSGTFYTTSGDTANIKLLSKNKWEISYPTLDGEMTATFETKWENSGQRKQSKTPMKKSDEYSEFYVLVQYMNESDIEIIMEDGNVANKMSFTKQKPKNNEKYDIVLQGDLSQFAGKFSNDTFNKQIADSGFILGGYSPDDYYNDRTSVFPSITPNGYWNGIASHGNYEVIASDMPKKVDDYFEVHVHGTNFGANNGELTFFLVPPNVIGPDGILSTDRRVFQVFYDGQQRLLEYQKENWWTDYQPK